MFVEAAGGVLVCGALACAASARPALPAPARAAALRRRAGLRRGRRSSGPAPALHAIACGLAAAGVLAMVVERLGRPLPLSWLDFVMGGCAVGALAVTTGAELPATLAAAGVAAALGLARWRVSLALACALAGLAALGELPVLAVACGSSPPSGCASPRPSPARSSARSCSRRSSPTPARR